MRDSTGEVDQYINLDVGEKKPAYTCSSSCSVIPVRYSWSPPVQSTVGVEEGSLPLVKSGCGVPAQVFTLVAEPTPLVLWAKERGCHQGAGVVDLACEVVKIHGQLSLAVQGLGSSSCSPGLERSDHTGQSSIEWHSV